MRNPELAGAATEGVKKGGREQVPPLAALDAQKKLVLHMTPERLKPYIETSEYNCPFMDALMSRYMDMYVVGSYNGFAEYCDLHGEDTDFMDRAINQNLTEIDFENMKEFLEAHADGLPFFAHEREIEDFIKINTH